MRAGWSKPEEVVECTQEEKSRPGEAESSLGRLQRPKPKQREPGSCFESAC
jgi:hypothetical protein